MVVFVGTDFVLEVAFEQEQSSSCEGIIALAVQNKIALAVPAFSRSETNSVLSSRSKPRLRVIDDLRTQVRVVGRSRSLQQLPGEFAVLTDALNNSIELEKNGV